MMMKTPYKYIPFVSPVYRKFKRAMLLNLYQGKNVNCPLCETSFSNWRGNEDFGSCPKCGSMPRHRLLFLYLKNNDLLYSSSSRILHFAPEKCWIDKLKTTSNLEYITADLSAPEADFKIDITDINFDSQSFDIVLCSHVLEHIIDDRKAINELFRVLTPGGTAYIQVPYNSSKPTDEDFTITNPQERKKRFGQSDHVRTYGLDFQQRLESGGFEVTQEHYAIKLTSEQRKYFGVWDDVIFVCNK